jgi:hypothetical protein
MGKKGLSLVTSTKQLELTNFSVTPSTENRNLAFLRLRIDGKI